MTAVSHSLILVGNVKFEVNRILALPTWADKNRLEQKWSNSKNVCVSNFPILNIDVTAGVGAPSLNIQLQATCMDVLSLNAWHIVVHLQSTLLYALKAPVTADCDISLYHPFFTLWEPENSLHCM